MAGTPAQRAAAVGVVEHGNSAVLVTVTAGGELLDRRRIDLTDGLPTHPHHHEGSWAVGRYASTPSVTGVESCHGPSRTISAASASRDAAGYARYPSGPGSPIRLDLEHDGPRPISTPATWARSISLPDAVALVDRVRAAAARGARDGLEALAEALAMPVARVAIRLCPELPPTTEERIIDNRAQTYADSVMYRQALATAAEARGWSVCWYDRERVSREAAVALGREDIDSFLRAMGRPVGPPWRAEQKLAAAAAIAAAGRP